MRLLPNVLPLLDISPLVWRRQSWNRWGFRGRRFFDDPHLAIGAFDGVVVLVCQTFSQHVSGSHAAILLILRGGGSNDERYPVLHVARRRQNTANYNDCRPHKPYPMFRCHGGHYVTKSTLVGPYFRCDLAPLRNRP